MVYKRSDFWEGKRNCVLAPKPPSKSPPVGETLNFRFYTLPLFYPILLLPLKLGEGIARGPGLF